MEKNIPMSALLLDHELSLQKSIIFAEVQQPIIDCVECFFTLLFRFLAM